MQVEMQGVEVEMQGVQVGKETEEEQCTGAGVDVAVDLDGCGSAEELLEEENHLEFSARYFVSPTNDAEVNKLVRRKLQRAIGAFEEHKTTQLKAREYYDNQLQFANRVYSYRTKANISVPEPWVRQDKNGAVRPSNELVEFAVSLSFWCNVALLGAKIVAVSLTGSVAVLVSMVDSALDVLCGFVLYFSQQFMDKKSGDFQRFPLGAVAAESVGVVVFSTLEVVFAVELTAYALYSIVTRLVSQTQPSPLTLDFISLAFILVTIIVKAGLVAFFQQLKSVDSIAEAYYQDHVNDIVSNFLAVIAVLLAHYIAEAWWVDPATGTLFAVYIAYNWTNTGLEHSRLLMCQTAPNDVLLEITYIAATFHPLVLQVDTVRAYHFGSKYIVEVDIVLPPTMTHKESHDIGDELQQKLESLPNVLRAYVHLDWETAHKPEYARAHAINVKKDS